MAMISAVNHRKIDREGSSLPPQQAAPYGFSEYLEAFLLHGGVAFNHHFFA